MWRRAGLPLEGLVALLLQAERPAGVTAVQNCRLRWRLCLQAIYTTCTTMCSPCTAEKGSSTRQQVYSTHKQRGGHTAVL